MIKVIDETKKLKGKANDPFDVNNVTNQMMGNLLSDIKKRLSNIQTNEDVTVTLTGTIDNIEFRANASPELTEQIRNAIEQG
tara:strand:+ start:2549 stop:2794 length:246 start_codon:yes stop_codon:yes gene_type:complete